MNGRERRIEDLERLVYAGRQSERPEGEALDHERHRAEFAAMQHDCRQRGVSLYEEWKEQVGPLLTEAQREIRR